MLDRKPSVNHFPQLGAVPAPIGVLCSKADSVQRAIVQPGKDRSWKRKHSSGSVQGSVSSRCADAGWASQPSLPPPFVDQPVQLWQDR